MKLFASITRLFLLVLVVFNFQACSSSKQVEDVEAQQPKADAPARAPIELVEGQDIAISFKDFRVKNVKGREYKLSDKLDNKKNNILVIAKPGCIYCESFFAVLKSSKLKTKANIIYLLDAEHASFEQFKDKAKNNKGIVGQWLYDVDNTLHDVYGVTSFPRFLVVDKNGVLVKHQTGLVLPKNPDSLKEQEFPVILKILSESTVEWLKQY